MYKETCKTTKFIDFKIKKYDNSVSFLTHSDYCLMGNTNVCCPIPWDVSHGITIGMTFPWTSLRIWFCPMDIFRIWLFILASGSLYTFNSRYWFKTCQKNFVTKTILERFFFSLTPEGNCQIDPATAHALGCFCGESCINCYQKTSSAFLHIKIDDKLICL